MDLKRIEAYANGNNPMSLDGYIDFKNPDRIKLDLSVDAKDFNLINAKKNTRAQAYGKVYVDLNGRINGTLQNLNVNGRLHVNGKTDVTYVMKDAPLSVSDQLNELVTFCDFADTTEDLVVKVYNADMDSLGNVWDFLLSMFKFFENIIRWFFALTPFKQ